MSSLNRDYLHSETDSLILLLCLQRNGLTGQDLRHPARTQGPHKYMTTRSHAKACQTQSGSSRSSEHKHMPYNSKTHDSPHGCIHACSPAITIQSVSHTHNGCCMDCLLQARCCISCRRLHFPALHPHKPLVSLSSSTSAPRRPDSFTLYSIQQPGADKSNWTYRID